MTHSAGIIWYLADTLAATALVVLLWLLGQRLRLIVSQPLFITAAVMFIAGRSPWLDQMARYSLWLHSWQSVMIHHLAPLVWMASLMPSEPASVRPSFNAPRLQSCLPFLLIIFGLLTWLWMLPSFHTLFMDSAVFYALMKWMMALSGISLCLLVVVPSTSSYRIDGAGCQHFWVSISVVAPMLLMGLVMTSSADLFSAYHNTNQHMHMMQSLPQALAMPAFLDQKLAGIIFIVAAVIYWLGERLITRPLSYPFTRPARVAVGVSPNKRRYS